MPSCPDTSWFRQLLWAPGGMVGMVWGVCPSALPAKRGGEESVLQPSPSPLHPPSALHKNLWYPGTPWFVCCLCCLVATAKHRFWPGEGDQLLTQNKNFLLLPDPYKLSWWNQSVPIDHKFPTDPGCLSQVGVAFLACFCPLHSGLWALGAAQGELAVFEIPRLW